MKMAFDPHMILPRIQLHKENVSTEDYRKGLKMLCQDFESILINSMFQEMRKSVPEDGFFERDTGMDIFQEMMDMEVAREMAGRGGLGLGKLLYEQLRNKTGLTGD